MFFTSWRNCVVVYERCFSAYDNFYFVIKTSIKLLEFYLFIYFYDTLIKSFVTSFFVCLFVCFLFLRKLLCNCFYKFKSMLRLVTVCRSAKAFNFYSGHPDVCAAIIIIIITRRCGSVYLGVVVLDILECMYLGNLHARQFRV